MKRIDPELRNEILMMTKKGHSVAEIMSVTGVSKGTIRKYQRENDDYTGNSSESGGLISRSIPVSHFKENKKKEEVFPVIMADQLITVLGVDTMTKYHMGMLKDTVTIEGDVIVGEVKIEDVLKLSNELLGVYNFVKKMKSNKFEPVN